MDPAYYRLMEAGRALFSHQQALGVLRAFEEKDVHVDFSSLAIFLLGITFVDQNIESGLHSLDEISDLKEFAVSVAGYDQYQEGSREQKEFLKSVAYPAVRAFLEISPGERAETRPHLSLEDVSPGGVEALRVLHRSLRGRSFVGEAS